MRSSTLFFAIRIPRPPMGMSAMPAYSSAFALSGDAHGSKGAPESMIYTVTEGGSTLMDWVTRTVRGTSSPTPS